MNKSSTNCERGFVLLPVALAILVIAAIAYLINRQGAIQLNMEASGAQVSEAQYVAEAGLNHAIWTANNSACSGYSLPGASFAAHSYTASFTPTSASPVSITATGTLANGTTRSITRDTLQIFTAATTVTLQPDAGNGKDNYLYEWQPSSNFGVSTTLWVRNNLANSLAYSLLSFDVSSLSAQAKIASAVLELHQNTPSSAGGSVGVRRVLSDWSEGSVSGANGTASWNERDVGIAWTSPGGDYSTTVETSTNIPSATVDWFQWNITNLVSDWVQGSEINRGLILTPESTGTYVEFDSSDQSDTTLHPKLIITYACECGVVCSTGAGVTLPIAHWKLDEGSGALAVDSEGGHDGALTNGPAWVTGKIDGGLSFDGANDFINVPHDNNLWLTGGMTFLAWAKTLDNGAAYQAIIAKDAPGNGASNYWFGIENDELVFGFWAAGAFRTVKTSAANLASSTWYHLGASFDNTTDVVRLYVDGAEVQAGSITYEPTTETADLWIGHSVDGEYWDGMLDDVRIYDSVLTDTDIADLAAVGGGGTYYLDEFNTIVYSGNDGDLSWTNDWQETSESDGPTGGFLQVTSDATCSGGNCLRLGHSDSNVTQRILSREADLSSGSNWTLSYNYGTSAADRGFVHVEVSGDGGLNWSTLTSYDFNGGNVSGSESFDLSGFIATITQIRFRLVNRNDNPGSLDQIRGLMFIDDIKIGPAGGGGIVYEEFTEAKGGSGGASLNINKPAGTATGDLLIAAVATDGSTKGSLVLSGWNIIDIEDNFSEVTLGVWWKLAGGAEPANYTITWSGDQTAYGMVLRFTGHNVATPINVSAGTEGASSLPTSPAVTTLVANTMIVRIGGFDDDDIAVDNTGLSAHTDITMDRSSIGTGTTSAGAGFVLQAAAGSSGAANFSLTSSEEYRSVTIGIAPQ